MATNIPLGYAEVGVLIDSPSLRRTSEVTFGVPYTAGTDIAGLAATLGGALPDLLQDMAATYHSDAFQLTIPLVGGGTGSQTFTYPSGRISGGTSGSEAPPNNAYLIKKVTGSLGRGTYGRMYLPGVVESKVDGGGILDPAWQDSMQDHVDSFLLAMATGAGGGDPAVVQLLSSQRGALVVLSLSVENKIATQRRRLR